MSLELKNNIKATIYRSEQWEWAAFVYIDDKKIFGYGSCEMSALLDLYENLFIYSVNGKK